MWRLALADWGRVRVERGTGRELRSTVVAPKRKHDDTPGSISSRSMEHFGRRAMLAVTIVALVAVGLAILWYTVWVWLLLFAGILLAVFLRALTIGLRKVTGLPDGWSLTIVTFALVAVSAAGLWVLSPRVVRQLGELRETLPEAVSSLTESMQRFALGDFLARQFERLDMEQFQEMLATGAATAISSVASAIIGFVVVVFLGFYVAMQPRLYLEGALHLLPPHHRPRMREVMEETGVTLMWWLLGRILAMAFVGVATALGLWALGVPLSFTLGLIAGVLDFIPNVGPVIAAVPAVLLAFGESPQTALWVLILYFVVQQLESYVVTPIVQQRVVHMPPALTVFVQVLFFVTSGLIGLLLATPIAAAGLVIVRELYVKDTLGEGEDETQEVGDGRRERGRAKVPTVKRLRAGRDRESAGGVSDAGP